MVEERHAVGEPSTRFCSFCNKSDAEAGTLIDGPWIEGPTPVFICNSCADLCSAIFKQWNQRIAAGAAQPDDPTAIPETLRRQLDEALKSLNLSDLESRVIKLRYGLGDGNPRTHKEIAEALEITPEKVRETEVAVIRKAQSRRDPSQ